MSSSQREAAGAFGAAARGAKELVLIRALRCQIRAMGEERS
jgi:hypothetical protein